MLVQQVQQVTHFWDLLQSASQVVLRSETHLVSTWLSQPGAKYVEVWVICLQKRALQNLFQVFLKFEGIHVSGILGLSQKIAATLKDFTAHYDRTNVLVLYHAIYPQGSIILRRR